MLGAAAAGLACYMSGLLEPGWAHFSIQLPARVPGVAKLDCRKRLQTPNKQPKIC